MPTEELSRDFGVRFICDEIDIRNISFKTEGQKILGTIKGFVSWASMIPPQELTESFDIEIIAYCPFEFQVCCAILKDVYITSFTPIDHTRGIEEETYEFEARSFRDWKVIATPTPCLEV